MEVLLNFKLNEHLYLRDPESSEVGKAIVKHAIELIYDIGFEQFTFKKLAQKIDSTEATIYRYFSSKHKLLTYILSWYWCYLLFIAKMRLQQVGPPDEKLRLVLGIITHNDLGNSKFQDYDLERLHGIVISESSKSYLVKEVDEINKDMIFSPLKSLCQYIAEVIMELKPGFIYPKSLASTLLETAHNQQFFSEHLPKLTDNKSKKQHKKYVLDYITLLAFSVIK
mgnify:CR=1 FL=1